MHVFFLKSWAVGKDWLKKNWAIIALIFFILLAYIPFYFNNGFLGDFGDPVGQTIPNKTLLLQYLKEGLLPLWNPFSLLGFPFFADIQVGAFYVPDLLIFALFPSFHAHNISVLLHLILGGVGMFLLLKAVGGKNFSSFSLALTFSLTGTLISRIVYLNFLETIALLPWVLWLIARYREHHQNMHDQDAYHTKPQTNGYFLLFCLALLVALMIFAGHPVAFFYAFIVITLFTLLYAWGQWWVMARIGAGLGVGICLAGIQIIPFLELISLSVRESLPFEQFVGGSLTARQLLQFFTPFTNSLNRFDSYIHVSTVAALLVIISVGFVIWRYNQLTASLRRVYWVGVVLAVLGIVLSLGGSIPWLAELLYKLPFVNLARVPVRYIVITHIGMILMILPMLSWLEDRALTQKGKAAVSKHTTAISTHTAAVSKHAALFSKQTRKKRWLFLLPQILLILNALLIPTLFLERHEIAEGAKQYPTELAGALEKVQDSPFAFTTPPHYVLSSSMAIFPNRHLPHRIPLVTGYNPLMLKNYHNVFPLAAVGTFENPDYLVDYFEIFEQIGVRYFLFPSSDFLTAQGLPDKPEVREFLLGHNWKLADSVRGEFEIWENPNVKPFIYFLNGKGNIENIDFEPGRIRLKMSVTENDTLIINQTYVPGWHMAVISANESAQTQRDKIQQTTQQHGEYENTPKNRPYIEPTLYASFVQSYAVTKDYQEVELFYRPASLFYGMLLTLLGLLLAFLIFLVACMRSKSSFVKNIGQFLRYCVVGATGTLLDLGVLALLVEFAHFDILYAATIAFLVAVTNNFLLNKFWTFNSPSKNYRKLYVKFLLVSTVGLLITLACMYLFTQILLIWYVTAKIITSGIVMVWNFLGNKFWTFRIHPHKVAIPTTFKYEVSFLIPAYNEAKRLPKTLEVVTDYIKQKKLKAEIIVVNDGSTDDTAEVIQQYAKKIPNFHPINYAKNQGKGYAVKMGIMASKGKYILFTDADNSTPIQEFSRLMEELIRTKADIAIGSRYLPGSNVKIKQPRYRIWMGRIGNFLIRLLLTNDLKDTQCGFKLFTHEAAKTIFSLQKVSRFGFDMEALTIAYNLDYKVVEVPVSWFNSSDSRVRPLRDAFITLKDMFYIKLNLWSGRYNEEE